MTCLTGYISEYNLATLRSFCDSRSQFWVDKPQSSYIHWFNEPYSRSTEDTLCTDENLSYLRVLKDCHIFIEAIHVSAILKSLKVLFMIYIYIYFFQKSNMHGFIFFFNLMDTIPKVIGHTTLTQLVDIMHNPHPKHPSEVGIGIKQIRFSTLLLPSYPAPPPTRTHYCEVTTVCRAEHAALTPPAHLFHIKQTIILLSPSQP